MFFSVPLFYVQGSPPDGVDKALFHIPVMEPLEVVGAAAALAQFIGLCVKSEELARSLVIAFVNAPKELEDLKTKLRRLRFDLQHIQALGTDLTEAGASHLFPDAHAGLITSCLESCVSALEELKIIRNENVSASTHLSAKQRLRWAALDKRKAKAILDLFKESEAELGRALNVLNV